MPFIATLTSYSATKIAVLPEGEQKGGSTIFGIRFLTMQKIFPIGPGKTSPSNCLEAFASENPIPPGIYDSTFIGYDGSYKIYGLERFVPENI